MRTTITIEEAKTRKQAIKIYENGKYTYGHGFVKCRKVCGGWMFFETWDEYQTWNNQK